MILDFLTWRIRPQWRKKYPIGHQILRMGHFLQDLLAMRPTTARLHITALTGSGPARPPAPRGGSARRGARRAPDPARRPAAPGRPAAAARPGRSGRPARR